MQFRIQEILKYIVPGLYFIGVLAGNVIFGYWDIICKAFESLSENSVNIMLDITGFEVITIFCVPIVGLVLGYCINFLASFLEYSLYKFCSRPSERILLRKSNRHKISEDLLKKEVNPLPANREECSIYLTKAKQYNMNNMDVSVYLYRSVLGRNIFMSQVLTIIVTLLFCQATWVFMKIILIELVLANIFYMAWNHDSHIYVKYVLSLFLRGLPSRPQT